MPGGDPPGTHRSRLLSFSRPLAITLSLLFRHSFPATAKLAALVRAHAAVLAFGLAYALLFFGRQGLELLLVLLAASLVCVLPLRLALGLAIHGLCRWIVALLALRLRVVRLRALSAGVRVCITHPLVVARIPPLPLLSLLLPLFAGLFALLIVLATGIVVAAACGCLHGQGAE